MAGLILAVYVHMENRGIELSLRGPTPTKIVCKTANPMTCLEDSGFQTKIPVYKIY